MPYPCDPCLCPEAYYRDSQSWRKGVIQLLCDIEEAIATITGENLWDKLGTVLSPHVAGDDVNLGTGDLLATDVTASNSLYVNKTTTPAIIYGTSAGEDTVFEIKGARGSGSDDGILRVLAGGAYSNGRGAYLELRGENADSSAGNAVLNFPGNCYLQGANADSNIYMTTNLTTRLTIPATGESYQTVAANESTGAGSAALGANCPAVTAAAPYTWIKVKTSNASVCYIPVWK